MGIWIINQVDYFAERVDVYQLEGDEREVKKFILQRIREDFKRYKDSSESDQMFTGTETINEVEEHNGCLVAECSFDDLLTTVHYFAYPIEDIETVEENTITLESLLKGNEVLVQIHIESNMYVPYHFIMDKDSNDIAAALEDTLHRLLDVGASDTDLEYIMGAQRLEELEEEREDMVYLDLGYVIPSAIISCSKTK